MGHERAKAEMSVSPGSLLAAAAAIAAGTQAYAVPVRFENTTGFGWTFDVLDITRPSDQQLGSFVAGRTLYQAYFGDYYGGFGYGSFGYRTTYLSGSGGAIWSEGFSDNYAAPLAAGTMVGPGLAGGQFSSGCVFEFEFEGYNVDPYEPFSGNRGMLPEGVQTYLGARILIGANVHYGWVGVVRSGAYVDPFAWGFESEPNTPIAAGADGPPPCQGNLNGDNVVDAADLSVVISGFGMAVPPGTGGDVNGDGVVDSADLSVVVSEFGTPCAEAAVPGTLAWLAHGAPGGAASADTAP